MPAPRALPAGPRSDIHATYDEEWPLEQSLNARKDGLYEQRDG